jgi:hypothetical protein
MKRIGLVAGIFDIDRFFAIARAPKTINYQAGFGIRWRHITVQKGNEKWEIAFDKDVKVTGGEIKKGAKVTVHYTMKAAAVDIKEAPKEAPKKK